jgi:lambda family phage portal protein
MPKRAAVAARRVQTASRASSRPAPSRRNALAVRAQAPTNTGTVYEAAAQTRRTLGWRAPTTSPNSSLLATLTTLRDRSRAAIRNDGYAKGVIDRLVTNIIGTGITPRSQAADFEFRKTIQAAWLRWTDESDADGQLDWYGQQRQAVRCWLESGESFTRHRPRLLSDGLSVPLQMQVLEPELCPYFYNAVGLNGARVRAGIEFDAIGRRVAYYFHPSRPELDDFDRSQLRRIPREFVNHLYDPLRAGQLRGLPHLTSALISLYEFDKLDDATLLKEQLANLFAGFITREGGVSDSEALHPLTGQTLTTDANDRPILGLEPGIFQELSPGETVQFSDPPAPQNYKDFTRQLMLRVTAGTGVPYEVLTGDMTGINDRTVRVILHEFRRQIQAWQHQIVVFQLCRPVWRAWMDRGFLSGTLPIPSAYADNPEPWLAVKWNPQSWPYLHPVQDVEAQKAAIRVGLTSRSAVVSEQGDDAEEIDNEQAADNRRADALGLKYDSDGRQASGTASAAPPADPGGAAAG